MYPAHLGDQLKTYVNSLNKPVRIERMSNRSGLIRARLHGAKISTGKTLTFLDAHCEVTIGWLETLLRHISENQERIVCPIIDVISHDTFEYLLGKFSFFSNLFFSQFTLCLLLFIKFCIFIDVDI